MRFCVLGPLEAFDDDGKLVELGGTQVRTVVAALVAAGGRVVSVDALLDAIWRDEPPPSAHGTLQSYVSRLRRLLGPRTQLLREPPGYRLAAEADDVDFRRFEALADEGRAHLDGGRVEAASRVLREAESLWRGPAFAEFADRDFAAGVAVRLEERRLAALEDRVAAELALGRHGALAAELTELVAEHPLREGLRAGLAVALYRAGRQADALRALDDARTVLRDELGVDPGRRLRDLEAAILAHDPALDAPVVPPSSPAVPAPPAAEGDRLVGRDAELAVLRAALEESQVATRAVVVEGEPGIGKTRLVEELAAAASARGATVLWGRAFEGGAAPAFWPWLGPLRALAGRREGGPSDVPAEVVNLLSPPSERAVATPGELARFLLSEGVAELIAGAAATAPVMLVLDDVQWADDASLELLSLVMARLTDVPVLVACTVRELDVGRNDAVVHALAELSRLPGTRRLHLRGLRPEATVELVARTAGAGVGTPIARRIHDRAGGNPFFTTELARLLSSSGAQGAADALADVPSGVRDVVRRRLAMLPEATQELLAVAAVVGRDVDIGLLARAARQDLGACLDALDPAVVRRLLVPVDEAPGTYRFAHALVREVVVDDISPLKRARLHLEVADALDGSDDTAEIVAEHLWAAVPIGAARRAAEALERAAGVAGGRFAYGSAKHLLERAAGLRRSAGSTPEDMEAELGSVAALISVVAAHDGYASLPDSTLLARGKYLAAQTGRDEEAFHLLWAEWAGLDVGCHASRADPIAEDLLARALALDDPVARVLGETAYGISCWHRGELAASARHLDIASELATRSAFQAPVPLFDLDQLRLAIPFGIYIHDVLGDLGDPERRFDDAMRLVPDDRFWALIVLNFAASGAISVGDYARAERAARRGMAADPEGMSAFWSTALRCYLGAAVCLQGRLGEGLPILDEAWARYEAKGLRTNAASWLAARAESLADAGRIEEAAASLADAERAIVETSEWYSKALLLVAGAAVARARGEGDAAVRDTLGGAVEVATEQGGMGIVRRVRATAARYGIDL